MAASSLHLPEVVPERGLEVPFGGIEADPEGPEQAASTLEKEARKPRWTVQRETKWRDFRYRRVLLSCFIAVLIVAIIVGPIFGTRGGKRVSPTLPGRLIY